MLSSKHGYCPSMITFVILRGRVVSSMMVILVPPVSGPWPGVVVIFDIT